MNDQEVVAAFVAHLRANGHPALQVDRRPDEENRLTPDIDAMAGPFAIEHTSIDTVANQRRDSTWFTRMVKPLERELGPTFSCRLTITLDYNAVAPGTKWQVMAWALRTWIVNRAAVLPDGPHIIKGSQGLPFDLRVVKSSDRPAGVFFARVEPEDDSLASRLEKSLAPKVEKLRKYQESGWVTVLLVESCDISLMNGARLLDALLAAFQERLPSGVDQLWYADTSLEVAPEFRELSPEFFQRAGLR